MSVMNYICVIVFCSKRIPALLEGSLKLSEAQEYKKKLVKPN